MKKILQAMDGASTKPVEGSSSMAKFLRVVKEAEVAAPVSTLPPEQLEYNRLRAQVDTLNFMQSDRANSNTFVDQDPQLVVKQNAMRTKLAQMAAALKAKGIDAAAEYDAPEPGDQPAQPVDLAQKYNSKKPPVPTQENKTSKIKQYFEAVQTEQLEAYQQRRAKINERARRIAQRMREDAKVSALDPAKKTITYTDDKTGISTTIPQAMAKPGEGGQVMVDKSQVNQGVGQDQQQPQAVKIGDMIKMMDTESSSAGVRMQRALQREKEKREFSQRYAEKHFPIGKKPEPIKEPVKDEGILSFMSKDKPVKKKPQALDPYAAKLLANRQQNKPPPPKSKVYQGPEEYRKEKDMAEGPELKKAKRAYNQAAKDANADQVGAGKKIDTMKKSLRQRDVDKSVAEGNEDPSWMSNLRLRK